MIIRHRKKSEKGTTLVEVIVATAVIAIMAGGVTGALSYGFFVMRLVRENQRATQIILEKAETIRLYSWSQVTSNGFIPAKFTNYYDPQGAIGSQGIPYTGTLAVTSFPDATSYSANMRQLTVTLGWQTRAIAHSRTLTTYISKDGLQNYVY